MKFENNHIYIGNEDRLPAWSCHEDEITEDLELTKDEQSKAVQKVRELIKNYLQLDSVNFLFGTGSSIHLGAASIQNIPYQAEKDIQDAVSAELQEDFNKYVKILQKSLVDEHTPNKDDVFKDERGWDVIYDGEYIRDYKKNISLAEGEDDTPEKHYGEILVMFESLLNYLTSLLYQREAENNILEATRVNKLIDSLKKTLFNICDVHKRTTSDRDLDRIALKGFKEEFEKNLKSASNLNGNLNCSKELEHYAS